MTDREMLMIVYGALKARGSGEGEKAVVKLAEEHLYYTEVQEAKNKPFPVEVSGPSR